MDNDRLEIEYATRRILERDLYLLLKARQTISRPKRWGKHRHFQKKLWGGYQACILGHLMLAAGKTPDDLIQMSIDPMVAIHEAPWDVLTLIRRQPRLGHPWDDHWSVSSLALFNDRRDTTHTMIMQWFEQAIARTCELLNKTKARDDDFEDTATRLLLAGPELVRLPKP